MFQLYVLFLYSPQNLCSWSPVTLGYLAPSAIICATGFLWILCTTSVFTAVLQCSGFAGRVMDVSLTFAEAYGIPVGSAPVVYEHRLCLFVCEVCVVFSMCVRVCVCVWERDRDGREWVSSCVCEWVSEQWQKEDKDSKRERESVWERKCVCYCKWDTRGTCLSGLRADVLV